MVVHTECNIIFRELWVCVHLVDVFSYLHEIYCALKGFLSDPLANWNPLGVCASVYIRTHLYGSAQFMWSVWKFSKIDISKLNIKKKKKEKIERWKEKEIKWKKGWEWSVWTEESTRKKRDQYKRKIMMVTGDEKGKAVYKRVYSWIL